MSNIIKEIEAEQLKATVDQFEVGDTVKVRRESQGWNWTN